MNLKKMVLILAVGLLLAFGAFFTRNGARAQQTNGTAPTPTVTPTPVIEEDDEVIKIDTEVVNVLFTAQDRNRRLITDLRQGDLRLL